MKIQVRHYALALVTTLVACGEPDVSGPPGLTAAAGASGGGLEAGVSGWAQVGGAPSRGGGGGGGAVVRDLPMGGTTNVPSAAGSAGAPPTLVPGAVVISELMPNEPGADTTARLGFVELYAADGAELGGITLELVNGADGAVYDSVTLAGSIAGSGYFVVGEADVVPQNQADAFNIQNGPDSVRLVASSGVVLDAVGYGDFGTTGVFAGEATACALSADGMTLGRRHGDTDDNAADFCEMTPTPGAPNAPCAGTGGTAGAGGSGGDSGSGGSSGGGGASGSGGSETGGAAGAGCSCAALL